MKRNGDTRRETDTETETQRETETRRDSLERGSGHLPSPLPHQESLRPPSTCWPSAQDRPCRPLALPGTGLPASSPAGRRRVTRDAPGGGLPSQQPGQAAWSRCQAGGKASCVEQPPPSTRQGFLEDTGYAACQPGSLAAWAALHPHRLPKALREPPGRQRDLGPVSARPLRHPRPAPLCTNSRQPPGASHFLPCPFRAGPATEGQPRASLMEELETLGGRWGAAAMSPPLRPGTARSLLKSGAGWGGKQARQ